MHRMSRWERRKEKDSSDDCNVVLFDQYSITFSSLLYMSYQIHITFSFGYSFSGSPNSWIELKEIGIFDQYSIRFLVYCTYLRIFFFLWWILNTECLYFLEFMNWVQRNWVFLDIAKYVLTRNWIFFSVPNFMKSFFEEIQDKGDTKYDIQR